MRKFCLAALSVFLIFSIGAIEAKAATDSGFELFDDGAVVVESQSINVVVIDSQVSDAELIKAQYSHGTLFVELNNDGGGLAQIAHSLQDNAALVGSIHIYAHGKPGRFSLGNEEVLVSKSFNKAYRSELKKIRQTLTNDADLVLFSCDFAKGDEGKESADRLAAVLGVDLAASEDITGNVNKGGNWKLEYLKGTVESLPEFSPSFIEQYKGKLQSATSISGRFWRDLNVDGPAEAGIRDGNEPDYEGLAVGLIDTGNSTIIANTTTAADGTYSFSGLAAGTYRVRVSTSQNYFVSPTTAENSFSPNSGNPKIGRTSVITATGVSGDDHIGIDGAVRPGPEITFGLFGPGVIDGSAPFNAQGACSSAADTAPLGDDCGADNGQVRAQDTVTVVFSISVDNFEPGAGELADVILEQTIVPQPGAIVNFESIPAACNGGLVGPVSSTTTNADDSVTLLCNVGAMTEGQQVSFSAALKVSGESAAGSTFTTDAKVYGIGVDGEQNAIPAEDFPQLGPFAISAAPAFDLSMDEISSGFVSCSVATRNVGSGAELGYECYWTTHIFSNDPFGNEAIQDFTYDVDITAKLPDGVTDYTVADGFDFGMTECRYNTSGWSNSVGGRRSMEAPGNRWEGRTVLQSGTCTYSGSPNDAGDDYQFTVTGADTSGTSYPSLRYGGADLSAGPFFVVAHRHRFFVPNRAIDAADGVMDGLGSLQLAGCTNNFDPNGLSGTSNFGAGVEPGFNGAAMPDGSKTNNCIGPTTVELRTTGTFAKYNWGAINDALTARIVAEEYASNTHSGDGVVEPGQVFSSNVRFRNSGTNPMTDAMACDIFDNTVVSLAPVPVLNGVVHDVAEIAHRTDSGFDYTEWEIQYATIPVANHNPLDGNNDGIRDFNSTTGVYEGNWSDMRTKRCDDGAPPAGWFTDPSLVPGGMDAVNAIRAVAKDRVNTALEPGQRLWMFIGFEPRNTFNGGPYDGEETPVGTVMANFGGIRSNEYASTWTSRNYVPAPESTHNDGDRYTLTRADLRLQKESIQPLASPGNNANALAGSQIIWQLNPTITSVSAAGTPVENVQVIDVLPSDATYNGTCTAATAGGTPPSLVEPNTDANGSASPGNTRLTWNLGDVVPNSPLDPIIICTDSNSLAPSGTPVVNYGEIRSTSAVGGLTQRSDTHTIVLEQTGAMQINKAVDITLDDINDTQVYTLGWSNFASAFPIDAPVVIDVLPFNGDGVGSLSPRVPASNFENDLVLVAEPVVTFVDGSSPSPAEGAIGVLEYTADAANSVEVDPNVNSSNWCTFASFGTSGCPASLAAVTAIRFTSNFNLDLDGTPRQGQTMTFTMQANGNEPGDIYTNRAAVDTASFPAGQFLRSNNVSVQIASYAIGDLIFADLNANGSYESAVDFLVPDGVAVNLRSSADDTLLASTDTATLSQGRFKFDELLSGDYYLEIPAAEFSAGGSLPGWTVSTPAQDPDTDQNETVDQSGFTPGSEAADGVRTADVTLSGNPPPPGGIPTGAEPTGDNVTGITLTSRDDFANLTVDIGLVPADSDGDCIPDIVEWGGEAIENAPDFDGDGTPDYLDTDSDGDGVLDADEVSDCDFSTAPDDEDGDNIPDYLDYPRIGVAKTIADVTSNADGSFTVEYSLVVENIGTDILYDVQLRDELSASFGTLQANVVDVDAPGEYFVSSAPQIDSNATVAFTAESSYSGTAPNTGLLDVSAGGELGVSESITVSFSIRFFPDITKEPYNNQASASGDGTDDDDTDASDGVSDLSDDGTDPDPDGDGQADEDGENDPTPLMIPAVGIAKNLASVTEVSNNVFDATFNFVVENLSTVEAATNLQIVENLASTFPSPVSFTVQSLNAGTLSANANFDGSSDTNMLAGSDNLAAGTSADLQLVVRVSTGGNNGPFTNQVTITTAETEGGTPTSSDRSDDGGEPDQDGDGNSGGPDEDDPTVFQLPPQEVALTKAVSSMLQVAATSYEVTFSLVVANTSSTEAATFVQVSDNLDAAFPSVNSISISTAPAVSGDLSSANAAFTGQGNNNLLSGTESLGKGESATITFTATIDFGNQTGPFLNTATASTSNTAGGPPIVTDTSDSGTDPNGSNPTAPGDNGTEDDPTPIAIDPQSIAAAKNLVSVVEVGSGVFDVTFDLLARNLSATSVANNVQLTENLAATFSAASSFAIQSVSATNLTVNPNYNGTSDTNLFVGNESLATSASDTVRLVVRVNTGGNNGPYSNQVTATTSATHGGTPTSSDASDDGTNPDANNDGDGSDANEDDPTAFQLPPQQVTVAKQLANITQLGLTSYAVDFSLVISNPSADQDATNVQLTDDLNAAFPSVSSISISSAPVVSGGLSAANAVFNGLTDTRLLAGNESLASGATATVTFQVTVDVGAQEGPFLNSAVVSSANTPGGPPIITDTSDDGTDPDGSNPGAPGDNGTDDDPTPVVIEPQAIGVAKDLGDVVEVSNNEFDVTFNYVFTNLSATQPASNVQFVEDFATTFAGVSSWTISNIDVGGLSQNPAYNGSSDSNLLVGDNTLATLASENLSITLRVVTGGNTGPFTNQVQVSTSNTAGGTPTSTDASDDGSNPDSNGDGQANGSTEDDPTVFQLPPQEIGLAKRVSGFRRIAGTRYEVDFELRVANLSASETATNIQVSDDIAAAFPGVASLGLVGAPNVGGFTPAASNFDGIVNQNLLAGSDSLAVGQSDTITFTVMVDFDGATGPFLNSAQATVANTPAGPPIMVDSSDDGTDPSGTNAGSPGDTGTSDDPTPISIPQMDLMKTATEAVHVSGPLWDVTYTFLMRNAGSVALSDLQLRDDLRAYFDPATVEAIPRLVGAGFIGAGSVNTAFDGVNNVNLLSGAPGLAIGGEGRIELTVRFNTASGVPAQPNTAYASSPVFEDPLPSDDPTMTPGDEGDKNPTTMKIIGDEDGDGAPDDTESSTEDRDGDGIPDARDYDPLGYFYCEDNGRILTGGSVTVQGPNGSATGVGTANGITILQDGSNGFYQFFHDGTPGTYELELSYPPQGIPSTLRLPESGAFEALSATDNPVILGSSEVGDTGVLADFSADTNSPYYVRFEMGPGAPTILLNNIPLTSCAGDEGSIALGKLATTARVVIGDFASYTLTVSNTESYLLRDVTVEDTLPPGFTMVEDSAQILRGNVSTAIVSAGAKPVEFEIGQLQAGEEVQISYLLRVGAGVVPGVYTNSAQAEIGDVAGSNIANADVEVVDDPLLNKTRVIGKVWHDRDGDAWQESAEVTGITLEGGPWAELYELEETIEGRITEEANLDASRITVSFSEQWSDDDVVTLRTAEGSVLRISNDGRFITDHEGKKKRGYTGQELTVKVVLAESTTETSFLIITNHGINEEGLAGVRLATVEGYVIETDEFGRYHIEDIGNIKFDIGSNYIVKVDEESLPAGTVFSTENPRVERLTQSLMSDIDFGVQLPRAALGEIVCTVAPAGPVDSVLISAKPVQETVYLDTIFFKSGSADISARQLENIQKQLALYADKENVRLRFTGHADSQRLSPRAAAKFVDNIGLSKARANGVAAVVITALNMAQSDVVTAGKGFTQPAQSNDTPEGMAQNRRVSINVTWDKAKSQTTASLASTPTDASQCGGSMLAQVSRTEAGAASLQNGLRTSRINFLSGKSELHEDQLEGIKNAIEGVKDKQNVRIRFVGKMNRSSMGDNAKSIYSNPQGLTEARAREVAVQVRDQLGLSDDLLLTEGRVSGEAVTADDSKQAESRNQRVEMELLYSDKVAGSVQEVVKPLGTVEPELASYGVVRVIEDRAVNDPQLSVISEREAVSVDAESIAFFAYSNYPAFIARYELSIYSERDVDRIKPLAVLSDVPESDLDASAHFVWSGREWQLGERYTYVLRAISKDERVDQTEPRSIFIRDPNQLVAGEAVVGEETHESVSMNNSGPQSSGVVRGLATIYGRSNLERQTIDVKGGRVRISGRGIDSRYQVLVAGHNMFVDSEGQFVLETHLPAGNYTVPVAMEDEQGQMMHRELDVGVDGKYMFMVGLANLTIGGSDIDGAVELLQGDERFSSKAYASGRVAFYLKGKVKGKYLITAQADTTEDELGNLSDNLQRKDPSSIFRRLEPDQYYPVYGDDSTLHRDTDTQGALYVRVDWDKSKALWGNFNTDMTQNEFAQYNRSLYGAQLVWNSTDYTDHNDSRWHVNAFVSEPQSVSGHNEFLSTGGSLYYLNQTDVVQGSERFRVEVRRRDTLQVVENVTLEAGKDYQFDHIQGRVILNRPLSMVVSDHIDNIIKDTPLEGDDVYLIADFEYAPLGFNSDDLTSGLRAEGWLSDSIGVGVSRVDENRAGNDYSLTGGDIALKAGEGTYVKLEVARSEAAQATSFESANGGLDFRPQKDPGAALDGNAFGVEVRVNLAEVTENGEGTARVWHKDREAGFSSSRETSIGVDTTDTGFETELKATDNLDLTLRSNVVDRKGQSKITTTSVQGDYKLTDRLDVGVEARQQELEIDGAGADSDALMVGARTRYQLTNRSGVYAEVQTDADSDGAFESNDLVTLGWETQVSEKLGYLVEVADGDRGSAVIGGIEYKVGENVAIDAKAGIGSNAYNRAGATLDFDNGYQIYGSYGDDPDGTPGVSSSRNVSTIGQRLVFGNGLQLYNEHQKSNGRFENGVTDVYGVDIGLTKEVRLGLSYQRSDLESNGQNILRDAATIGTAYRSENLRWASNLEYRQDESEQNDYTQWLTTNSLEHALNDDTRWLAKANYSVTEDDLSGDKAARLAEGSLGLAYRPVWHDRMNLLGRYTYLYDLVAPNQTINRPDQRSHVVELESIYDLSRRWEFGAKVATRRGSVRLGRDRGQWFDNGADLFVLRARYHMVHQWDGLLEYRQLSTTEVNDKRAGWLAAIYRHLGKNFKLGVGYNFTDFSDDLTDLDYEYGGWHIDAVGKF